MAARRSIFKPTTLFILLICCWEGGWLGQTHAQILQDDNFGSSDDQIKERLFPRRSIDSNLTADECANFYGHVCKEVTDSERFVPNVLDEETWGNILNTKLEALISADVTPDDEPAIQKVKRQYKLCMNYDRRDYEGPDSLKSLIQRDSDFPMIMRRSDWDPLTLRILEPQKYDPSLLSIRVRDGKIYIDQYDVSAYGRFLSNLKNVPVISNSVMYISKIEQVFARMALIPKTQSSFDKDLYDVMNFRRELHQIAKMERMVHKKWTVRELERVISIHKAGWPRLNWESYLRYVFLNASEVEINLNTTVYIEMDYLIALRNLLQEYEPRCIANHIKLHFLETYLSETSRSMMQISKDLATAAHETIGQYFQKDKTTLSLNPCIHHPHILRALNYEYLKKWFPKKSRDAAIDMVRQIKNSLKDKVKMTKEIMLGTPRSVWNQIDLVTVIVGSEEKYADYNLLDPLYRYEVPDDHLSSVLNTRRYLKDYEYSTLTKSKNTNLTRLNILEDKPYVFAKKDQIHLPIGYLHRMSLSPTLPEEISYATLGYKISLFLNKVIIKKGFPSHKFLKVAMSNKGDSQDFWNRISCIDKQYNLHLLQRPLSTDEELKENYDEIFERYVYDNAAFQTLYTAFKSAIRDGLIAHRRKLSIQHMEREFMKNFANWYCIHKRDETNASQLRVNHVLRNSNIFHLSFDCSDQTFMNPREKCIFWG